MNLYRSKRTSLMFFEVGFWICVLVYFGGFKDYPLPRLLVAFGIRCLICWLTMRGRELVQK